MEKKNSRVVVGVLAKMVGRTVAPVKYHTATEKQRTTKKKFNKDLFGLIVAGISFGVYWVNDRWFDDPRIRELTMFGVRAGLALSDPDVYPPREG